MPFETYDKGSSTGKVNTNNPQLSLRKSGTIGFNAAARQKFLQDYDYAVMQYDKENELIGIIPKKEETGKAYKIRKAKKDTHGAQINCKGFTTNWGLIPEKTTRYKIQKADRKQRLVVDLDDEIKKINS